MSVSSECCVLSKGSGLCDELITRSQESYRLCLCLILCDLATVRRPRTQLGCCATGQEKYLFHAGTKENEPRLHIPSSAGDPEFNSLQRQEI
jgi:hypothetical protein